MKFKKIPWAHDPRSKSFSHERFFGSVANLPATLGRVKGKVLQQGGTLRCTGYGSAANGYYIHGVEMSPDWQAFKIGQLQKRSVDENGGDPNATMKSMRDYGFLPSSRSPFSLEKDGAEGSGFNAPWPDSLDGVAQTWDLQVGFVRVDGPNDIFDNIRNALFLAYDTKTGKGACVDAFGKWYHEWTNAAVVPTEYSLFAGYHRYIFVDWVYVDNICYLVAQNSYGEEAGANGFHLFPREVVNKEFALWGTSVKILKVLTQAQIDEAKKETPMGYLWRLLLQAWFALSEKYGRYAKSS